MIIWIYNIVLSLIFTVLIELIISIILGVNKKSDLIYIVLINVLTNPITEFINLLIKDKNLHHPIIFIIEIIITIIEFLFYKKFLKSKNINFLCLAIINNIVSYLIGIIFNFGVSI